MNQLDNKSYIKKLDKKDVLSSIENLPRQFEQVVQDFSEIDLPLKYFQVKDIVISGMGGSGLGGHIIQSLFFEELKIPLRIINGYTLPKAVNKNTLCIIVSYSGTTEETIATYFEAKKKKANIFVITRGAKLAQIVKKEKTPTYIFEERFNPTKQPRLGLGYTLTAELLFLNKLRLLNFGQKEKSITLKALEKFNKIFGQKRETSQNIAKKIAFKLYQNQKTPILVGSEFLIGSLHFFSNQLNETAKTLATYFALPELNHHLMEGLTFPKSNRKNLFFLFFNSSLYQPKIILRYRITQEVLAKNKIISLEYKMASSDKISQTAELLTLGSYVSFYLGILNKIDPSEIPWVDYFKKKLSH